jgi:hypothetical protein
VNDAIACTHACHRALRMSRCGVAVCADPTPAVGLLSLRVFELLEGCVLKRSESRCRQLPCVRRYSSLRVQMTRILAIGGAAIDTAHRSRRRVGEAAATTDDRTAGCARTIISGVMVMQRMVLLCHVVIEVHLLLLLLVVVFVLHSRPRRPQRQIRRDAMRCDAQPRADCDECHRRTGVG